MSRICPDCKTDLESRSFDGVTIDACSKCAGIFFDSGEVGQIKARGMHAFDEIEDAVEPSTIVEPSSDRARHCPCCHVGMDKFRYQYNSQIVLDECEKCGGIWVQDGELRRMREFLEHHSPRPKVQVVVTAPTPVGRIQRVRQFLHGVAAS